MLGSLSILCCRLFRGNENVRDAKSENWTEERKIEQFGSRELKLEERRFDEGDATKMADVKVNVYTPTGDAVGYFLNPVIKAYPEGDYEVTGEFFDSDGSRVDKLNFNPQALPYSADMSAVQGLAHSKLEN